MADFTAGLSSQQVLVQAVLAFPPQLKAWLWRFYTDIHSTNHTVSLIQSRLFLPEGGMKKSTFRQSKTTVFSPLSGVRIRNSEREGSNRWIGRYLSKRSYRPIAEQSLEMSVARLPRLTCAFDVFIRANIARLWWVLTPFGRRSCGYVMLNLMRESKRVFSNIRISIKSYVLCLCSRLSTAPKTVYYYCTITINIIRSTNWIYPDKMSSNSSFESVVKIVIKIRTIKPKTNNQNYVMAAVTGV